MYTYAPVVKMVITSPCHGEGHRFKSGRARQEIIPRQRRWRDFIYFREKTSRKPATFGFLHGGAGTNTLVLGVPEILADAPMLSQQL